MAGKKAAFHNLGCKVNAYETEVMQGLLEENGYEIVPFEEEADVYIINTCTVTSIADRKSRQMLHRARKRNPHAVVVAAGCYAQMETGMDECVDIILGNNRKKEIVRVLEEYERGVLDTRIDVRHTFTYEEAGLSRTVGHTRAYIKVQDGCDQFCSYCIIPFARGRARSRTVDDALREVRRLAANGYKEVVLTGIHLSSYGADIQSDLLSLILKVHEVEGIRRIRLSSLEPRIITEEFAETLSALPKICPHFHLSLQSGCNGTLARMNRRYTAEEYEEKCRLLRRYFCNPALTTDIIVGFPGETQEEFAKSRAFIDRMDFYETHIFKYSRRAGTKAAAMSPQVPEKIKAERSALLLELNETKKKAYEDALVGTVQEVLVEERVERDDGVYQVGHTKEYVKIGQKTTKNLENQLINVEIQNRRQIMH